MRLTLIAALGAGLIAAATPAAAEHRPGGLNVVSGDPGANGIRVHRGAGGGDGRGHGGYGRNYGGYGDAYLPYRDYQGDTLWRRDSFNDWWHDHPERAYPRWVANNQDCQRRWWSGGAWRC